VHDSDMFDDDDFVGRVVLPSLSCGQVLSDWFPLQVKVQFSFAAAYVQCKY
jgi:hypothetical protein